MPQTALRLLTTDPDTAFTTYGFIPGDGGQKSGPCGIKITKLFDKIYKIEPDFAGRGHYFFAYGRYKQAESVDVPVGQADGTVAFTAPMNGCSLQVNRVGGIFRFYHDPMSNSMTGKEPGDIVCRVGPKDYDRFERGAQQIESMRTSKYGGTYGLAIVSIHHGGKWKVYSSPVAGTADSKGKLASAYVFTASVTPLMTSFADG